ncbi:MAG: MBL fold metallo-hydrolase [Burkholderiaceae bacterium]
MNLTRMTDELPGGVRFIERDWLSANMVQSFDGNALTVIDTGYASHAPLTESLVQHALQTKGRDAYLARVLNTHLHSDHCGGNAVLQQRHAPEIHVPAASLAAVQAWDERALTYTGTAQYCPRFRATHALNPGDRFIAGGLDWVVHAAPGHDPHSLVFFAPQPRLLISADALWRRGFGIIFPELVDASGFAEQAAVLELIESLQPRLVIPGHGPIFTDVADALANARDRLAALRADPARNSRGALRGLLMFRLLDLRTVDLDELIDGLQSASILQAAAAQLGQTLEAAIRAAVDDLVGQGQIRRIGKIVSLEHGQTH